MKALRLVLITSVCILMALAAKAQVKIGENKLESSPHHWLEIDKTDSLFIVTDDLSVGLTSADHRVSAPNPNVDALMLKLYGYGLNNFLPSATSPFIQDSEPIGGITANIFAGITQDGYLMEVPLSLVIEVADSSQADLSFFNGVDTFGTADLMVLDTIFATDNELRDSTALIRTLINNSEMADHDTISGNEFIDSIRLSNDTLYFIENLAGRIAPTNTQSIDLGPLINGSTFYLSDGELDESRTVTGQTFDLTYTDITNLLESSVTNTTTTSGDQTLQTTGPGADIIINSADAGTFSSTSLTTINGNNVAIQQDGQDIMQINGNEETKFLSGTVDTILLLDDDGSISMEAYGDSSITGVVSQILAVDASGNMIEIGITDILATQPDSTIYTHDGLLTEDRVLTGGSNDLTMTGLGTYNVGATTVDLDAPNTTVSDTVQLESYGGDLIKGTVTTILAVDTDGNVIETTASEILGTETDSTIYTHNGTLTGERTMTMGVIGTPRDLFFVSPNGDDTTVIASNGRIGISTGSFTPNSAQSDVKLEVNGDILAIKVHSSSDRRFKKNISPIQSALDKVMSIEGVTYDFRKEDFLNRNFPTGKQVGFIAQNVESVLPEVVMTNGDGYKAVDYSKITALLNEAIKEQQAQINQLQERLERSSELNASLVDEIATIKKMIKEFSHLADSDED